MCCEIDDEMRARVSKATEKQRHALMDEVPRRCACGWWNCQMCKWVSGHPEEYWMSGGRMFIYGVSKL